MTKNKLKIQAQSCIDALKQAYPDAICSLEYREPLHLLIATRLAAQCTDARVNMVTPALFAKYPDAAALQDADVEDIARLIHSCGFYKTKSQDIVNLSKMICTDFDGKVPDNMEDLLKLPGIGRKTANLVLGDVYGKPAVVTDTHCIRIAGRLGLTKNKVPAKVETDLREILPPEESNDFCHRLVLHGRAVCTARTAKCEICCMAEYCDYFAKAAAGNGPEQRKKSGKTGKKG